MADSICIVTALQKERGKMRVTIDERQTILVPLSLFRERPLEVGMQLDMQDYDNWLMVREYRHALDRAVVYLTARARTSREVEQRLLRSGYLPSAVEMVVYKLEKEHILNDEEFAAQWVEARKNRKLGKYRIASELARKGVNKELSSEALESFTDDEQLREATALAEKLLPRYADEEPFDRKRKLSQAMARRGFSWDIVKQALSEVL